MANRHGDVRKNRAGWLTCEGCGRCCRASVAVRQVDRDGARRPLCYDCYELTTGGEWRRQDEYWDGHRWVPLRVGA
jgi:hypothetical protein